MKNNDFFKKAIVLEGGTKNDISYKIIHKEKIDYNNNDIENVKKRNRLQLVIGLVLGSLIAIVPIYYSAVTTHFAGGEVGYVNTSSGLSSDNVEGAIDELYNQLSDKVTELETINTGTATLNTTYVSGSGASITYVTKGGIAYVVGKALVMKNGSTTGNHSFQVATGLPVPANPKGVYITPVGSNGGNTIQVHNYGRYLWINTSGVMTLYTWGTLSTAHYFSVSYPIAAS